MECLKGKADVVNKCKTYLTNNNFWNNAKDEVGRMLPKIAVDTLRAFEFDYYKEYDEVQKQELVKVDTVSKWLEKLKKLSDAEPTKLSSDDFNKISKNPNLLAYLELVVSKVNANPAILNENYKSAEQEYNPDKFKGTQLYKLGLRQFVPLGELSVGSITRLGQAIDYNNTQVRISLPNFIRSFKLSGGGPIEDLTQHLSKPTVMTHSILNRHYMGLIEKLASNGKSISPKDNAKIQVLINRLRDSEIKLTKTMLYIEKYAKLLDVFGEQDNTKVLSVDHLQNFVENRNRHFERVAKKQSDLITIIRTIAEAVNKEVPEKREQRQSQVNVNEIHFRL